MFVECGLFSCIVSLQWTANDTTWVTTSFADNVLLTISHRWIAPPRHDPSMTRDR